MGSPATPAGPPALLPLRIEDEDISRLFPLTSGDAFKWACRLFRFIRFIPFSIEPFVIMRFGEVPFLPTLNIEDHVRGSEI